MKGRIAHYVLQQLCLPQGVLGVWWGWGGGGVIYDPLSQNISYGISLYGNTRNTFSYLMKYNSHLLAIGNNERYFPVRGKTDFFLP